MESADQGGDLPAPHGGGVDDAAHVGLAGQVGRGDGAVLAQRPADAEGGPPDGFRGAAGGQHLHGPVPQVIAVAAGPGRGQRLREQPAAGGRALGGVLVRGAQGPAGVGQGEVAAADLHTARTRPADRGQLRGEVRERVERRPALPDRAGQGDGGHGLRIRQVLQPRLEVGRQLDAHDLRLRGVQQRRNHRRQRGAVVAHTQQVRRTGRGERVHGVPRIGICGSPRARGGGDGGDGGLPGPSARHRLGHRRFPRRSQRRRHIAEPSSARRRTGPSQ